MIFPHKNTLFLFLLCTIFLLDHTILSAIEIVSGGRAKSVIVIRENAPEQMKTAAKDLQKILLRMSGALLPVVTEKNIPRLGGKICIGENSLTKKNHYSPAFSAKTSAYDIVVKDDLLILNGPVFSRHKIKNDPAEFLDEKEDAQVLSSPESNTASPVYSDYGPMHAVSAFLEYLGVRFYAPGEDGIFVPVRKNIKLANMRIKKEAAFAVREYLFRKNIPLDAETSQYLRFLKSGSFQEQTGVIPLSRILKKAEKTQPSFFALDAENKRYKALDEGGLPRYSDEKFRKICAEEAERFFKNNPHVQELMILPPPAFEEYIHYADEIKYEKKQYPVTYRRDIPAAFHISIAEKIEKKYPGKKILFRLRNHLLPAKSLLKKFPSSLILLPDPAGATIYGTEGLKNAFLASIHKYGRENKNQKVILREYWNEYNSTEVPRQGFYFMQALQEARKKQREYVKGFLADLPFDKKTKTLAEKAQMHFILYVNSKLLWDPDLDLKKLQKEYCRNYYGPAAEVMEKFLSSAEEMVTSSGSRSLVPTYGKVTQQKADLLLDLLQTAGKKTQKNTLFHQRITELKKSFQWMKKDIFGQWKKENLEKEKYICGEIFPQETVCDGNLSKYKKWHSLLPADGKKQKNKTQVAIAINENRYHSFFAFRCYEKDMNKVKAKAKKRDSLLIEKEEHIKIDFYTERTGNFTLLVNSAGVILDKSNDPETLRTCAEERFWDHFRNTAKVKRYPDRWEVEVSMVRRGSAPHIGFSSPWKINLSRISFLSGEKNVSNLSGNEKKYTNLFYQKTDSKGRDYNPRYNTVNIPIEGIPYRKEYTVTRVKGRKKFSFSPEAWNGNDWKNIPVLHLGNNLFTLGKSSSFVPKAQCKMQYDDQFLYVFYKIDDQYVRGFFRKDQSAVCTDSCIELFLRPGGKKSDVYFNFELNCVGYLLLAQVKIPKNGGRVKFHMLPVKELQKIKRYTSLSKVDGEIKEKLSWYAALQIPWDLLEKYSSIPRPGKGDEWSCNIYKCADWSSHPHWITWQKTVTFHAPDYFGRLLFE